MPETLTARAAVPHTPRCASPKLWGCLCWSGSSLAHWAPRLLLKQLPAWVALVVEPVRSAVVLTKSAWPAPCGRELLDSTCGKCQATCHPQRGLKYAPGPAAQAQVPGLLAGTLCTTWAGPGQQGSGSVPGRQHSPAHLHRCSAAGTDWQLHAASPRAAVSRAQTWPLCSAACSDLASHLFRPVRAHS